MGDCKRPFATRADGLAPSVMSCFCFAGLLFVFNLIDWGKPDEMPNSDNYNAVTRNYAIYLKGGDKTKDIKNFITYTLSLYKIKKLNIVSACCGRGPVWKGR